jgi:hypothetical protein
MTSARKTFLWMGALSVLTLVLGALREFVIARDLQTSGAADLFFRGLVVVGASRNFGLALFRARWIPVGPQTSSRELLARDLPTLVAIVAVALAGLAALLAGAEWLDPASWVFAVAIVLAVFGGAVRALAERAGLELQGIVLDWSLPLGTIVGAVTIGHGALGPVVGMTGGLAVGIIGLAPIVFGRARFRSSAADKTVAQHFTRWLLLDTLTYVNLGLLEGAVSKFAFAEGGYAVLNYAYLFINAALAVPTAAATVVSLRIASSGAPNAQRRLRGWAVVAGAVVGTGVLATWAGLGLAPIRGLIDGAAGWSMCDAIRPLVLYAVPFAALRLANTVGRQFRVATDPRRLIGWDVIGLVARTIALIVGAHYLDILASPLALALAEVIQLATWVRADPHPTGASSHSDTSA